MEKYVVPVDKKPTKNPKRHYSPLWKRTIAESDGRFPSTYRHDASRLLIDSYAEGVYLASVTKSGCLTVHDFETLYCLSYGPTSNSHHKQLPEDLGESGVRQRRDGAGPEGINMMSA
ncbi:hypothetical protein QJS10_CPA10g00123 [Acorus calamus]|uniref:Uncharacterized protein n=1 Tax=Acorus calamus TaxID=4465 RepID=A0AAV9DZF4_ACOCL|nr:hypothetical protein QJS10_CPA10g00123 [Acorus calamus]